MRLILLTLAAAFGGAAHAQDAGWSTRATLYAWAPAMDVTAETPFGDLEADLSIGDVLSDLDMAFMGAVDASRGRWRLAADLVYSDLTATKERPLGRRFVEGRADVALTAVTGYALYRVSDDPRLSVELGGGFRAFWMDVDVALDGSRGREFSQGTSDNWIDPLLALRIEAPFTERLTGAALVDYGGVDADDRTWQALATLRYGFNDRWSGVAGYRYMAIERETDGVATTIDLSGPLIGASYRF